MMPNAYSLPPRKARLCRWAGAVFLLCAVGSLLGAVVIALWPAPAINCSDARGCHWQAQPVRMLKEDIAREVATTPGAARVFDAYVARPAVRAGIFGATLIDTGPFAMLLAGVGLALRRLGGSGGDPFASALPSLRRASLAAIVWAVARPLGDSLLAMLLSPGTPPGRHWYINVDLLAVGLALMLAVAAYATVWALEAGLRAQRDLDAFV